MRRPAGRILMSFALTSLVLPGATVSAQESDEQAEPPQVGAMAPDFSVPGATRYGVLQEPVRLSDYRGKTVVLAFFPKARTRGCTIQMHAYRDRYADLFDSGQNVILIAMSVDPAADLYSWARDDQFQFLMASDEALEVAARYGAARSGRPVASRYLFVIAPDGWISYRAVPFREIDPTAYDELEDALADVVTATTENGA